uniref:TLC domain-containing protein n=1 Tax=Strigamia maritima TaxID=126957 RepID=T1J8B5_STRMM
MSTHVEEFGLNYGPLCMVSAWLFFGMTFYRNPKLAEDVIEYYADSSHLLLSFSFGYFVFDFVDLMIHNPRHSQTYELVIHHIAVSSCFFISMVFKKYIGYATAALVIEMSNVCLHTRQLLHLSGISRDILENPNKYINAY